MIIIMSAEADAATLKINVICSEDAFKHVFKTATALQDPMGQMTLFAVVLGNAQIAVFVRDTSLKEITVIFHQNARKGFNVKMMHVSRKKMTNKIHGE